MKVRFWIEAQIKQIQGVQLIMPTFSSKHFTSKVAWIFYDGGEPQAVIHLPKKLWDGICLSPNIDESDEFVIRPHHEWVVVFANLMEQIVADEEFEGIWKTYTSDEFIAFDPSALYN